ncbi:leucyl aminopeptidase [Gordonia sp. X0973]|uniref:leucyl aminopeptidase n=1 Tax=Gordonia sp. X0973 TaxID=2742602 RepID=UPI000F530FD1|nr:leucyl aminopeptidase [Gordonia sp. X0973]QKT07628.1 leucyl aminopeptidase [Gordonia sp. X0973]
MSNSDTADRVRGPEFDLATTLSRADSALLVGLAAGAGSDASGKDRFAGDDAPTLVIGDGIVDDAVAEALESGLVALGATGKHGEITRIPAPAGLAVDVVVAVGLGPLDEASPDAESETDAAGAAAESLRQAAGIAARELAGHDTVATTLSTLAVGPVVEGLFLGAYRFELFRSAKADEKNARSTVPAKFHLLVEAKNTEAKADLAHAVVVADSVAIARDLVNTPPSHLYPEEFAKRAAALGKKFGLDVEVFDDEKLEREGYGGIVGVGKGSSRKPRLVRLTHAKKDAKSVALVGKGITFDTGGISIKPAANMDHMTSDMGGAAAVVAAVIAAARLDVDATVVATVPMAENMPSGTAQRPGDVLTQYGGKTIEVLNTDAEGRLILADAIVRALEDEPDYLIDTATLTGAQMVALGTRTPGVMGTREFRDRVAALSRRAGENGWAMPIPPELRADLTSRVADMANITPHRFGGMLAAATYLKEFVPAGQAWAHIDIAGPAFNSGGTWGYNPKGGTGVPVRTLIDVIEDIAANG